MKFSDDQLQQLNEVFDKKLRPIQRDINSIGQIVDQKLEVKLEQKLKPIRRDINSMKKDLNYVIGKYDARLNHLEKHTSHPPLSYPAVL